MGVIGSEGLFGGVKPNFNGKCIRKEGFGCPEGTPSGLGCSPQKTATEICYGSDGVVLSKKRLNPYAPYQTRSSCDSTNPNWVRATATSSKDKFGMPKVGISTCPSGYEKVSVGSTCCKPIMLAPRDNRLKDNSLADNKEKSNKTLYIIGAIALLGVGYYMYKKK